MEAGRQALVSAEFLLAGWTVELTRQANPLGQMPNDLPGLLHLNMQIPQPNMGMMNGGFNPQQLQQMQQQMMMGQGMDGMMGMQQQPPQMQQQMNQQHQLNQQNQQQQQQHQQQQQQQQQQRQREYTNFSPESAYVLMIRNEPTISDTRTSWTSWAR